MRLHTLVLGQAAQVVNTCSRCGHEATLRSGTVMQESNLPVRDWLAATFLLTTTKPAISAKEIQRQLSRKR